MTYDMERAIDLGTAIGTIRSALMQYESGLHELAIKSLRETLTKLEARAEERYSHSFPA